MSLFGALSAGMSFGSGLQNALGMYNQSKQQEYNAKVMARDLKTKRRNMIAARRENAKRETQAQSQRTAQLTNMYAASGIEVNGDVSKYIARVAAVDELNKQQLTQDAYYNAAVIDTQIYNLRKGAAMAGQALELNALTTAMSAPINAAVIYNENSNYWDKYGPFSAKTPNINSSWQTPKPSIMGVK